jgi:signal peptidase I
VTGDCSYHDFDEQADRWETRGCLAYREAADGARFTTFQDPGAQPRSYGPVAVPAGHVFVLGDNRDHSSDSRYWGFVPDELIEGKAMFVWFSYGEPDGVRLKRLFHPVR